jgi:uncharacterized protein with HEPN domain
MSRSALDRLHDIVDAADLVTRDAGSHDATTLAATAGSRDAALFRLLVVCEAASQLPSEIKALAPEVPWPQMRGMRNEIVHGYWQIDFAVVADTINHDLEPLKLAVQRLIALMDRSVE